MEQRWCVAIAGVGFDRPLDNYYWIWRSKGPDLNSELGREFEEEMKLLQIHV
jgi:hypothetical protein